MKQNMKLGYAKEEVAQVQLHFSHPFEQRFIKSHQQLVSSEVMLMFEKGLTLLFGLANIPLRSDDKIQDFQGARHWSIDKPLLGSRLGRSYEKIPEINHGDPETLFLKDPSTNLQLGKKKTNVGNGKSFFKVAKGTYKKVFTGKTTLENKVLARWEICYDIAQKADQSSRSPEVRKMAKAVLAYGPLFDLPPQITQFHGETKHIESTINLFYMSLQSDSLNSAERIWSVGVLSYLKSQIPETRDFTIPRSWTANDLGRPRGHFLEYFLQGEDLGRVAQRMWLHSPPTLDPSIPVIHEAIRRESVVHIINEQIAKTSTEFRTLFLAFINLKDPTDSEKTSSLMKLLVEHLQDPETLTLRQRNEEHNTIRMILHLEEYNHESYLQFKQLTETKEIREVILEADMSFQLAENKLSPKSISLLEIIKNTKTINERQILEVLDILNQEELSIPQVGRFFRALHLLFKSNREMYGPFELRLDRYPQMILKISPMLKKYRLDQMKRIWVEGEVLEPIFFLKNEKLLAKRHREYLANILIEKGVLSEIETERHYFSGESKELREVVVHHILFDIFKKASKLQAGPSLHSWATDDTLIEYILHLISFKNDDMTLYRLLRRHGPSPRVDSESGIWSFHTIVHKLVHDGSWNDNSQIDEFRKALKELEAAVYLKATRLI
ncbi:uncharacterized protein MELLADRAFT_94823 [Melampsora larici-populina 98AG31]|uniref:Uncharacterized protein n=1 Tax=Melampsora larici-populina (strain 98AG31 / pathotype 3-4-7) TaxID=747676 RepID=F4S821_MELLP|nr:uncharacterized protein MELLADRAFT_94823 [Melampsora larici-populina 98AG31]EGF99231.1 hypothetical protein MELLADRAFT_94823 [Melampsora larici-populina 98AG31]